MPVGLVDLRGGRWGGAPRPAEVGKGRGLRVGDDEAVPQGGAVGEARCPQVGSAGGVPLDIQEGVLLRSGGRPPRDFGVAGGHSRG